MTSNSQPEVAVESVSTLVLRLKAYVGKAFHQIRASGEISNLHAATSGHYYFTLKDSQAQIRAAWFRAGSRAKILEQAEREGKEVIIEGRIDIYPPQGSMQIIVESAEIVGSGDLAAQFEALHKALAQKGYFAEEQKKALPRFPQRVGIVTSPRGAAIKDMIAVFERRYPLAHLIIAPTLVQGEGAATAIAQAIARLDAMALDAIIIARGGGSIEDLWAFNEERVIEAIYHANTPIVAGVGHETDITLCDLVADVRAATPTAAAEALAPDAHQLGAALEALTKRLVRDTSRSLLLKRQHVDQLSARLLHPGAIINARRARIDSAVLRAQRTTENKIRQLERRLTQWSSRIVHPKSQFIRQHAKLDALQTRLNTAVNARIFALDHRHQLITKTLLALGPDSTLERGFAIISKEDGSIVSSTQHVSSGESLSARVRDGIIDVTVRD